MNELQIEIEGGQQAFMPGETIRGRVQWQMNNDPRKAILRIFWFTQGKGTEDSCLHEEIKFENPGPVEEHAFEFVLPVGPYSFSGRLISLIWMVELEVDKKYARQDVVLSPTGQEIKLGSVSA